MLSRRGFRLPAWVCFIEELSATNSWMNLSLLSIDYNTDWKVKPKDARYEQLKKILNVIDGDEKVINALYPVPPRTKQEIRDNLEYQLNGWCSR